MLWLYRSGQVSEEIQKTGSLSRRIGSGRPSKATAEIKRLVNQQMKLDDETTAVQLHRMLTDKSLAISLRTILLYVAGPHLAGPLEEVLTTSTSVKLTIKSSIKLLAWACELLDAGESFDNAVWTDENTIQVESHRRFCCRKRGEPPKLEPKYSVCTYRSGSN